MDQPAGGIELAPRVVVPEAALQWTFSRGGGPGGQNVNKVNTRATLTVNVSDLAPALPVHALTRLPEVAGQRFASDPDRLVITSADSRSQVANRESCLEKLREILVQAMHRPKRRRPTKPSRAAVQRRIDSKKRRSQRKEGRSGDWTGD